jgi:hypothetical protein
MLSSWHVLLGLYMVEEEKKGQILSSVLNLLIKAAPLPTIIVSIKLQHVKIWGHIQIIDLKVYPCCHGQQDFLLFYG